LRAVGVLDGGGTVEAHRDGEGMVAQQLVVAGA
jgi:hypothetical protein